MWTLSDFDYDLPDERIAQSPLSDRSMSRLLRLDRQSGTVSHTQFKDILSFVRSGDVLVLNNSKVIPARVFGAKATGGKVELLLLNQLDDSMWKVLAGGKKLVPGTAIHIFDHNQGETHVTGSIVAQGEGPIRTVEFSSPTDDWLHEFGYLPLPPYITSALARPDRYQTVYARPEGSAAAPTAGLHFTPELLLALRNQGVHIEYVTLHIGLDTFKPVSVDSITDHTIHTEWASLKPETAERINQAKLEGGRIIAVGTTSTRTLETAALRSAGITGSLQTISERDASGETFDLCPWKPVAAIEESTDLYIYPGYRFRAIDAMITNFHMPKSTLMMLVSAFAGREAIMNAYQTAIETEYRFLSLGDAMFIA